VADKPFAPRPSDWIDEVANGLSYYDHTFLRELPRLYGDLEDQLAAFDPAWNNSELRSFILMGSWIGGDRDGNPFVTADVLRQTIDMQSKRSLISISRIAPARRRALARPRRVSISAQLQELIGRSPDESPRRAAEPYRRRSSESLRACRNRARLRHEVLPRHAVDGGPRL